MPPDQPPIPPQALPPGWGPADLEDERFGYRCREPPVTLIADRKPATRCHPSLGIEGCWELCSRYALGDRTVEAVVGRVSTRTAAVEGLLACMHTIHDDVEEPTDPVDIRTVLEDVPLADVVPEDTSI